MPPDVQLNTLHVTGSASAAVLFAQVSNRITQLPPGENIAGGQITLVAAEAAYAAEGPSGGHVVQLTNPIAQWVGVGAAYSGTGPFTSYLAEEFN